LLKAAAVGFIVLGAMHNSVPSDLSFVQFDAGSDPKSVIELVKQHVPALRGTHSHGRGA
jgi:hypothetical protein